VDVLTQTASCRVCTHVARCLQVEYQPDFRQDIAATWPQSIDDSRARADWGWAPRFHLDAMTEDMLAALLRKYQVAGGCVVRAPTDPDDAKAAVAV
jgi:nucleoside-diphosphate-sugar epimerase